MKYVATLGGTSEVVEISGGDGRYHVTIGNRSFEVDGRTSADGIYSLLIGDVSHVAAVVDRDGTRVVDVGGSFAAISTSVSVPFQHQRTFPAPVA